MAEISNKSHHTFMKLRMSLLQPHFQKGFPNEVQKFIQAKMLDKNKILSKSIIQEVSIKFPKLFGKGF